MPEAQAKSVLDIRVPPVVYAKLTELAKRLAAALGEPLESSRRCVELSMFVHGLEGVEREVEAAEEQARRLGWPQ